MVFLTIHRAAHQVGGNCVEIEYDGHRLLLDAGSSLDADEHADDIPPTLDRKRPIDGLVISHPHLDHYGLLDRLPADWPVWSGAPTEILMRLTASIGRKRYRQSFRHYRSGKAFRVGPFKVTPFLVDHSAFDAHMLLVEAGGRRIFYSGDFRRTGRKSLLTERLMRKPPRDVDVLLLEGTTLGRTGDFPTETDIEQRLVDLLKDTKGRIFVTWSAQNIDRTVTLYRACKRARRTLVLDVYAAGVLDRLATDSSKIPRLGWPCLQVVVTKSIARMYKDRARVNDAAFVDRCATSGFAFGADKLESRARNVIMLRPSLWKDYARKGVTLTPHDGWVFSMWSGYEKKTDYAELRTAFESAGARLERIHTSGHAAPDDLVAFADAVAPRHLVPIHGFDWDQHLHRFKNVKRLRDGERFAIV
ncbi:MBL fold metallo-hydrolase [bacterium]|nr:MBL fold metallo-hydrolase [bacterium]